MTAPVPGTWLPPIKSHGRGPLFLTSMPGRAMPSDCPGELVFAAVAEVTDSSPLPVGAEVPRV